MKRNFILLVFVFALTSIHVAIAEDGYRLWLRYDKVMDENTFSTYRQLIDQVTIQGGSPTLNIIKEELDLALQGLLNKPVKFTTEVSANGLVIGTPNNSPLINSLNLSELKHAGEDGYILLSKEINNFKSLIIAANTEIGLLYGTFHFLKLLQTHQPVDNLNILSVPKIKHRILNHWDNLDRTVERGYAGFSIWNWHTLPDHIDQQYLDYARANASIGINGTVLTNVNANALVLTKDYIEKVAALANAFRPYGIRVYLTARFSAPIEIGGLKTADPLNDEVKKWWKEKAEEIYSHIPDFGGFLVKANSEGQPGPQNYGRTHADGANMLADAVADKGGIVMWRAFVYDNEVPDDRAKQAFNEFKPFDGTFRKNVLIQVKNGAIDFQPREPFHPLFGAMPQTPLMMEFQITQEYLGQGTHLAYLAPLFKEALDSDTFVKGKGSTVAKVIDGSLDNHSISGIAGVANIGTDRNWTGNHFGQSNWYAFGRLAWDHSLTSQEIAEEWIKMTFNNHPEFVSAVKSIMMGSRETVVNYMTPLGLHHIMGWDHHYGPGPWITGKFRDDWTSTYYHKADKTGLGFNRTKTGSNALEQYHPQVQKQFGSLKTCPEEYLLWFHRVKWDYKTRSGRTLWDELCYRYYEGAESAEKMLLAWNKLEEHVDPVRFRHISSFLKIQHKEAKWWRDACVLYFQTFSGKPIPQNLEKPSATLEYYMSLNPKFVPGI